MSSRTEASGSGAWTTVLAATFFLAAALRLVGLQSGLWFDEIMTLVLSVRHPLRQILTEFPALNVHPLYSVLAHASIETFGESAWALRLPACLFGVASVVMAYVLGARLLTRAEAWVAAAVMATSYHHIWFSQNARGYTLLGCLTLVSTFFLLRAGSTGRRGDYAFYALACAAGIYTHLTMAFVVAGHAAVMLIGWAIGWRPAREQPIGPLLWAWAGAGVLSALAYAPFVSSVLATMGADAPREAAKVATAGWALGEALRSLLSGAGVPAALVGGAVAAIGGISVWRRQPLAFALLIVPAIVTAAALYALGQPLRPRFFFFLSGAAAIFVGRGIGVAVEGLAPARLARRPSALTAGIVLCTLVLVAMSAVALPRNYRLPKQDFDGAVRYLDAQEAQGAEIAAAGPGCLAFELYYGKTWRCLKGIEDWRATAAATHRVLVVHTLTDYVDDLPLRQALKGACPVVQQFAGTLGDGDIFVCEPRPQGGR